MVDISEENANHAAAEIIENGGQAFPYTCDVTNQSQVVEIYNQVGRIDILVNSAGISHIGKADTTSAQDFDRIVSVNIKGVYNSLFAAIPLMKQQHGGVILNMSSVAAIVGLADRFAYSMSKGAVYAMTMSVAKDYINDGIRCNCISPGRCIRRL